MPSFLFVEKRKLFIKKSSFEEFNLVFFTAEPMVCFERQPSHRSFCWIFRYILHSMAKTITFLKGNLCIFKCFKPFNKFLSSALKKNYKMCPDLRWILYWILQNFAMCLADVTCANGSTIQIVFSELFERINFLDF